MAPVSTDRPFSRGERRQDEESIYVFLGSGGIFVIIDRDRVATTGYLPAHATMTVFHIPADRCLRAMRQRQEDIRPGKATLRGFGNFLLVVIGQDLKGKAPPRDEPCRIVISARIQ